MESTAFKDVIGLVHLKIIYLIKIYFGNKSDLLDNSQVKDYYINHLDSIGEIVRTAETIQSKDLNLKQLATNLAFSLFLYKNLAVEDLEINVSFNLFFKIVYLSVLSNRELDTYSDAVKIITSILSVYINPHKYNNSLIDIYPNKVDITCLPLIVVGNDLERALDESKRYHNFDSMQIFYDTVKNVIFEGRAKSKSVLLLGVVDALVPKLQPIPLQQPQVFSPELASVTKLRRRNLRENYF